MAYVVIAKWRARPGREQRLLDVIREMSPPSRAEPGNLAYRAHRSLDDPQLFLLFEQYVDAAAYEAHMASDHFTRLVAGEAIPDLLEDRSREFYETLGVDADADDHT